jgi:peptidoglycan/xylan/chitin deacetylase (PgdA/CDA1 family)
MSSKAKQIGDILGIPVRRLPAPRILITMDLEEKENGDEMWPVLEVVARHHVPMTLFVTNRSVSGRDNRQLISEIVSFFDVRRIPLEIASHSVDHRDLRLMDLRGIAAKIEESLRELRDWGAPVHGFRAPYLGIEGFYRDLLTRITADGGSLVYDSSTSFEANLATSLFHAMTRRKSPHKIGNIWELPISCLDDYHLLEKTTPGACIAYPYWVAEAHLWIRSLNYFMVLFHPYVMSRRLGLLDRFLDYCRRRFSPPAFCRCMDLADELESGLSASVPAFPLNLQEGLDADANGL